MNARLESDAELPAGTVFVVEDGGGVVEVLLDDFGLTAELGEERSVFACVHAADREAVQRWWAAGDAPGVAATMRFSRATYAAAELVLAACRLRGQSIVAVALDEGEARYLASQFQTLLVHGRSDRLLERVREEGRDGAVSEFDYVKQVSHLNNELVNMQRELAHRNQQLTREVEAREQAEAALQEALRRAEALRRKAEMADQAKGRFLAQMSHEVRTPMIGILGMADLLAGMTLAPVAQERVSVIQDSARSLLTIVNDILDFARLEAGRMALTPAPFSLVEVAEQVVYLLAPLADGKGVRLLLRASPALPGRLVGDAGRIRQILLNLVGNAVKFTDAGTVRVSLDGEGAGEGFRARLCVEDTGIGISAAELPQLFERFVQLDGAEARAGEGSGLGLSIVKQLIDLMGGRIDVESRSGAGSVFTVDLPLGVAAAAPLPGPAELAGCTVLFCGAEGWLAETVAALLADWSAGVVRVTDPYVEDVAAAAASCAVVVWDATQGPVGEVRSQLEAAGVACPQLALAPVETAEGLGGLPGVTPLQLPFTPTRLHRCIETVLGSSRPAPAGTSRGAGTLLLVDDNRVNRLVLREMLRQQGYRVLEAGNGRQALERLAAEDVDLVLMDRQMPEMDGEEATRLWRAREAEHGGPRLPVVALTASTLEADRQACLAAGMDDCLTKPIAPEALADVLRRYLEGA